MSLRNNYKGFSLIELVVYIGLVSIMLLGIASFAKTILQTRAKNQVILEVEQQGIQVMQILSQTIRNAESIVFPSSGSNANTLTLNLANPSANPTTFSFSNGFINIQEGGALPINLINSRVEVQNLIFENLSRLDTSGIIKFSFVLNYNNQSGRPEYNYSKTFYGSASLR